MSVSHDVGLSCIQRKANNRQGRPSAAAACRDCRAKVEAYATMDKRAATRRYQPYGTKSRNYSARIVFRYLNINKLWRTVAYAMVVILISYPTIVSVLMSSWFGIFRSRRHLMLTKRHPILCRYGVRWRN